MSWLKLEIKRFSAQANKNAKNCKRLKINVKKNIKLDQLLEAVQRSRCKAKSPKNEFVYKNKKGAKKGSRY